MSYEKQTWEALPSQNSPFSADRMNHIEEGIEEVDNSKVEVETVTNDNGEAIKFSNGTMICRHTVPKENFKSTNSYSATAQGISIYRSNTFDWIFPVAFINTNIQIGLSLSNQAGGTRFCYPRVNGGITKNRAQIQLLGLEDFTETALGYTTLNEVYITAIGRWK